MPFSSTPSASGQETLEYLEHANLFIVPLDNERRWYRYHHLFADVLRMHLMAEQPDQVSALHRRASEWYEHNGSTDNAIRHALAAEDFARAADLIELVMPAMSRSRQFATLLGWLKALPDELVHVRPVLSIGMPMRQCLAVSSGAWSPDCGTPNGGWTRRPTCASDRNPRRRGWSS